MITPSQLESLGDKEFRHLYVSDRIRELVSSQIRATREQRGWSQKELGDKAGMAQERVSLLEDSDYSGMTLKTLRRLGEALDVALIVEYVSFLELVERNARRERLAVPSYDASMAQLHRDNLHVIGDPSAYKTAILVVPTATASSGALSFRTEASTNVATDVSGIFSAIQHKSTNAYSLAG